jgi:hypothetical protein
MNSIHVQDNGGSITVTFEFQGGPQQVDFDSSSASKLIDRLPFMLEMAHRCGQVAGLAAAQRIMRGEGSVA